MVWKINLVQTKNGRLKWSSSNKSDIEYSILLLRLPQKRQKSHNFEISEIWWSLISCGLNDSSFNDNKEPFAASQTVIFKIKFSLSVYTSIKCHLVILSIGSVWSKTLKRIICRAIIYILWIFLADPFISHKFEKYRSFIKSCMSKNFNLIAL